MASVVRIPLPEEDGGLSFGLNSTTLAPDDYDGDIIVVLAVSPDPLLPSTRMMMTVLQVALCILGVAGNAGMFAVILRNASFRVWGNYLHLSLAALHLIGCLVMSPLYLVSVHGLLPSGSILRKVLCRLFLSLAMSYEIGSCMLLSQIAVCRYYILVHGHTSMVRPHWSGKLWPAWVTMTLNFALTCACKPSKSDVNYRTVPWPCMADDNYFRWQIKNPGAVALVALLIFICLLTLAVSYIRTVCWVRKRRRSITSPEVGETRNPTTTMAIACVSALNQVATADQTQIREDTVLTKLYKQTTQKNSLLFIFAFLTFMPFFVMVFLGITKPIDADIFIMMIDISWIVMYLLPAASPLIFIWGRTDILRSTISGLRCSRANTE